MADTGVLAKNWVAKLDLELANNGHKTVLKHRKHQGPLMVQKPFYPEGGLCHLYVLHPPGGIVGGDQLEINVALHERACGLITTPGANKFYRSSGDFAYLNQFINLSGQSSLEWMPQETIYFSGCKVQAKTLVNLNEGAHFSGWEISCFGQPASDVAFTKGICHQHFEIWQNGAPLVMERNKIGGGQDILTAKWGLQGYTTMGTFIVTPASQTMLEMVQELILKNNNEDAFEDGIVTVTLLDNILVCRALAYEAQWVKHQFSEIWKVLRPRTINKEAILPRIWST